MSFQALILLVGATINSIFLVLLFSRSYRWDSRTFLGIGVLGVTLWGIVHFLLETFGQKIPGLMFYPYISASIIPSFFLIFSIVFPDDSFGKRKYLNAGIIALNFLIILLILLPGVIIGEATFDSDGKFLYVDFGPLYFLYVFYIVGLFATAFIVLLSRLAKVRGLLRAQILYIFIGALLSALIGVATNLFLPALGNFSLFWLGPSASIFFVISATYAVFRHHLFNIRVVGTEVFTGVVATIFFAQILLSQDFLEFISRSLLFVLILGFGILLVKGTLREVEELRKLSEAKSEFISLASHQLRTPLAAIKGYVSMLNEGSFGRLNGKVRDVLQKVYLSNDRLVRLVDDLLNISRIEQGRMKFDFQEVSITEMIQSVTEELKLLAGESGLEIIWRKPENLLPPIKVDPAKFRQVILNLLDNAIRYTNSGYVNITANPKFKIQNPKQKVIMIEVKDTGIGMTKKELENIFERFQRGAEVSQIHPEGLGLGLYLAKRIVEAHKGRIWAESPGRGQGSTFYVEIPIS